MSVPTWPPGPRGLAERWRQLRRFRHDPLDLLTRTAAEYGPLATLPLGPVNLVVVTDPDLIEQVLVVQHAKFVKGRGLDTTHRILGQGLLTSEGDFWRRQRRLAQPAFHKQRIVGYGETMVAFADRHVSAWRDGDVRDLLDELMRLTLAIAAQTLFSADVTADATAVGEALTTALEVVNERFGTVIRLPDSWPTPSNRRMRRAAETLDRVVYRLIDERMASGEDNGDLLSMLLAARDEDGSGMSRQQLRDEAMTIILAGHETTANALTWTLHLLDNNPAAEAALHAELDTKLGGRLPTVADLPNLPYLEAVVYESMRLYPPAWTVGRQATEPVELGGYRFPAGTDFLLPMWVVHRRADFFPDPLAFRPERWLDGLARRLPTYAYYPFGGGPRLCIGRGFALMEAPLLLAVLCQRFRYRRVPGHPVVPHPSITLRPRFGLKMKLERR